MHTKQDRYVRLALPLLALGAMLDCGFASGQQFQETQTGIYQGGSFETHGQESINLGTLDVIWNIPIFHKDGRGIPVDLVFSHDNSVWQTLQEADPPPYGANYYLPTLSNGGWSASATNAGGYLTATSQKQYCDSRSYDTYLNDYTYTDPSGGLHSFTNAQYTKSQHCIQGGAGATISPDTSSDGYVLSLNSTGKATIITPAGITSTVPVRVQAETSPSIQGAVTDSNGNQLTYDLDVFPATSGQITDTLGMTPFLVNSNGIAYTDSNGRQQTVQIAYQTFTIDHEGPCGNYNSLYTSTVTVPTTVTYPDGTFYGFTYETLPAGTITGRLASVHIPSGGTVSYSYQGPNNGTNCFDGSTAGMTRTDPDGTTTYVQTTISASGSPTSAMSKTDPSGNVTQFTFSLNHESAGVYVYNETSRLAFNGAASGTPVYSKATQGAELCTNILSQQQTSNVTVTEAYDGQTATQSSSIYTGCLLTERDDYIPGATIPYRKKLLSYRQDGSYLTNMPTDIKTEDSSGNIVAETRYGYDETPVVATSGIPQHGQAAQSRANQTSVSLWDNTNSTWLTTTKQYDDTGNVVVANDTTGLSSHQRSFTYEEANSFPQSLTMISPSGASLVTRYHHDMNTGLLTDTWDPNGQHTSYVSDLMNRLNEISYPDGGKTSVVYTVGSPSTITTTTIAAPNPDRILISVLDGFGRVVQSQLTSDPSGTTYVDQTYDALGRLYSQSNPYRSKSDQTYGLTTYSYDALDRIHTVTLPPLSSPSSQSDSSAPPSPVTKEWDYTGNTVTYYDENRNEWQQTRDSFGRLSKVLEPGSPLGNTPDLETDYGYNVLDNLIRVDQIGNISPGGSNSCYLATGTPGSGSMCDRVRQFGYDSLSRLTSSTNPETGTISYLYTTANGNQCSGSPTAVCSRQDARGVTTSYQYDALDRITGKSYSNDPTGTAPVSFAYDNAAAGWIFPNQTSPALTGTQQTNLMGRLSSETNGTSTTVYGYDPMGRTVLKSTCTPLTCSAGDHFDQHYQYDLAGDMKFSDIGLDAMRNSVAPNAGYYYGGLTLSYNGAAQLITGTADIVDPTHPSSMVSGLQYSPFGGVTSMQLGGVYGEGNTYSPRGWVQQRNGMDPVNGLQRTGTLVHDNVGNVTQLLDSSLGTTTYGYDTLNRLTSFSNPYAGVTYGYDAWGNLTTHTQTVGAGYSFSLNYNTNNQTVQAGSTNGGLTYDASGDVLFDGLNKYTYDAEARLLSVNGATSYVYGPDGKRVATAQGDGIAQEYLYDLRNKLVTTLGPDGKMLRGSLYGGEMHLADYTAGTGSGGGQTEFRFTDEVNSLAIKLDQAGTIVESCYQNPFGESLNCSGPTSTSIATDFSETHFTDKKRDQESGLDYFGARYYGSTTGRFMSPDYSESSDSPDPVPYADFTDPQSLNLYSYAYNNPLNNTDADGHLPCGGMASININVSSDGRSSESQSPDCDSGGGPALSSATGTATESLQDIENVMSRVARQKADNMTTSGASNTPCMSGPLNVSQNMQASQQLANKFNYGTPGQAYDAAKSFINLVHTGGAWDPKSGPGGPTDINVAAGNINFGATCSQFGFNSSAGGLACQVGAGLYQFHTQGHFGSPFFSQYHGDTPSDNMQIRQGLAIAKKGGC